MKLNSEQMQYFYEVASPILKHPAYLELKKYAHHVNTDRYEHCLNVAVFSYCYAIKHNKKVDLASLIRGALLHDFFLGDIKSKETRPKHHRRTHPQLALETAEKYFTLNDVEKDIIIKHMYPLTPGYPLFTESHIVVNGDNFCSCCEFLSLSEPRRVLKKEYNL